MKLIFLVWACVLGAKLDLESSSGIFIAQRTTLKPWLNQTSNSLIVVLDLLNEERKFEAQKLQNISYLISGKKLDTIDGFLENLLSLFVSLDKIWSHGAVKLDRLKKILGGSSLFLPPLDFWYLFKLYRKVKKRNIIFSRSVDDVKGSFIYN